MTSIQIISLASVIVYVALILLAAHILAKKSRTAGVGGKRLPWFIIAATTMATVMNAAQLLGTSGSSYQLGLSQMLWANVIGPLCSLLFIPLVGERLRFVNCATLSDVADKRFPKSKGAGIVLNIWFFVWGIFACSLSIFGGAVVLQTLLGVNFWVGCFTTVIIALIYNALGGLEAMSVVDTVQYVFVGILVAILIPILFIRFGTFSSFCSALVGTTGYDLTAAGEALGITPGFFDAFHLPGWGGASLAAYICACALWTFCDMGVIQRFLAERAPGEGVKGVRTYTIVFFPTLILIIFFGLWGRGMFPSLDYVDSVTLKVGEAAMGSIGTVLFMVATVAAILSTVGAYLNALGLTVVGFYKKVRPDAGEKTLKLLENVSVLVVGLIALLGARIFSTDGITITCVAIQMCMVATISPMLLLMCTWKRFNGKAAFWGFIAGITVCLASTAYAGGAYAAIMGGGFFGIPTLFLGWIVCLPIYIIGSLISKYDPQSMSPEFLAAFENTDLYMGKKDPIVAAVLLVIVIVTMSLGFNGKLGIFPTFGSAFGVIDAILLIFSAVAFFGCLFLSYKLIRFLFIDKDFYTDSGEDAFTSPSEKE